MNRRNNTIVYIIFTLLAIGVVASFVDSPGRMVIPLLVFGLIFYFYKFPPRQYRKGSSSLFGSFGTKSKQKRKTSSFRVIQGNKKNDDEEDRPPYH